MTDGERATLERTLRTADLLCSSHACLRDQYRQRAICLNLSILTLTVWLAALAFVSEHIADRLSPDLLGKELWNGLLAVSAAVLAIIELRVDWKERAAEHGHASKEYARIKSTTRRLLESDSAQESVEQLLDRFYQANEMLVPIPESKFLRLKQHHHTKVAVSRLVDGSPGTPIWILKAKLLLRRVK